MPEDQTELKKGRDLIRASLKTLLSAVLIFWLLRRIGVDEILASFRQANGFWLLVSLVVLSLSNVLGAIQWHWLLANRGVTMTMGHSLWLYYIGLFFNNFLLGNVGGGAFRIYEVRRISSRTDAAFATVFLDRFIGFFALSTLAVAAALLTAYRLFTSVALLTVVLIFVGWLVAIFFLFYKEFALKFSRLLRWMLPTAVHVRAKDFYNSLNAFRHEKRLLWRVFFLSLVIQTLRILSHWNAARALGLRVSPAYFFLFIPVVALLASLPISLGGIGVREQSAVTLFSQIGIASGKIVAFELLAYAVGILAALPGGVLFVLRKK